MVISTRLVVPFIRTLTGKKTISTVYPRTRHEGPEREEYNSTLSLTSALGDLGLSTTIPSHSAAGKVTRYPLQVQCLSYLHGKDSLGDYLPNLCIKV